MKTSTRRSIGLVVALVSFGTCFALYRSGASMIVVSKQGSAAIGRWDSVTPLGVVHFPAMALTVGTVVGVAMLVWPRTKKRTGKMNEL